MLQGQEGEREGWGGAHPSEFSAQKLACVRAQRVDGGLRERWSHKNSGTHLKDPQDSLRDFLWTHLKDPQDFSRDLLRDFLWNYLKDPQDFSRDLLRDFLWTQESEER